MKYLTKFATETEYNAYISGSEVFLPNVSLIGTTDVRYNPIPPPVTNWIKLSGLDIGDPVEVGSGYDPSDLDNNPPILYDSNGDVMEVVDWQKERTPFGTFLAFKTTSDFKWYYIDSFDSPQYITNAY